jgi:hypothetical protein
MMKYFLTIVCFMCLVGCKSMGPNEQPDHFLRIVSFPVISLADGERVSAVQINMTCGRFQAINKIPNDWSLEIEGPVSERSTLKAVANHGSSWLSEGADLKCLQHFATIMVCDNSYFDISATVFTNMGDEEGKKKFRKDQLKLEKLPNN